MPDGAFPPSPTHARECNGRAIGESADWTQRGEYIRTRHGITPREADEALVDPSRAVHHPGCNSESGRTDRVVAYSHAASRVLTVIVMQDEETLWGVNAWPANARDRRTYLKENTNG